MTRRRSAPSSKGCPLWSATALQAHKGSTLRYFHVRDQTNSALRLWRELSCVWSVPSFLAHCSQGFNVPGRRLYSLCSVVSLLVSVLLVVGARSTRVRVFHEKTQLPSAGKSLVTTYDSEFSQNMTILDKLDVEWPAVVGVLELENKLRFNLFCFNAARVCSIFLRSVHHGRRVYLGLGSAQVCTMKELTMRTGCFSRSSHPHRFRTISKH